MIPGFNDFNRALNVLKVSEGDKKILRAWVNRPIGAMKISKRLEALARQAFNVQDELKSPRRP